jgi:hypothetical protein
MITKIVQRNMHQNTTNRIQWCSPVIPALGRLRQKGREFKASLGLPQKAKQNKTTTKRKRL